jgi:aryl-alcohol dehydrogenase-like predicted oxidoreductase
MVSALVENVSSLVISSTHLASSPDITANGRRHNVPIKAAALQFSLAHPATAAVIPAPASRNESEKATRR